MRYVLLLVLLVSLAGCDIEDSHSNPWCYASCLRVYCFFQNESDEPWTPDTLLVRLENKHTGAVTEVLDMSVGEIPPGLSRKIKKEHPSDIAKVCGEDLDHISSSCRLVEYEPPTASGHLGKGL